MGQNYIIAAIAGVFSAITLSALLGSYFAIRQLKAKTEEVKKHRIEVERSRSTQDRDSGMMAAHR